MPHKHKTLRTAFKEIRELREENGRLQTVVMDIEREQKDIYKHIMRLYDYALFGNNKEGKVNVRPGSTC